MMKNIVRNSFRKYLPGLCDNPAVEWELSHSPASKSLYLYTYRTCNVIYTITVSQPNLFCNQFVHKHKSWYASYISIIMY